MISHHRGCGWWERQGALDEGDHLVPKTTTEFGPAAAAPHPNKTAAAIELLRRQLGASLRDLTEATGWQPHTTRAALSA
jgi:hypothetical protein